MKKITFLIFMSLLSFVGFSQTFPEGFEGASALPTGWLILDNGVGMGPSNTNLWLRSGPNSATSPPHNGQYAYSVERVNIGIGNTEEDWLITPSVTVPANGQLRFYAQHGRAGDQGSKLQVRISTGSVQNNMSSYTITAADLTESQISSTAGTYVEQVINLSSLNLANQDVYIAFVRVYTQPTAAVGGDRFVIDDINLVQQCLDPTNGIANAITTTTASLSWTNPSGSTNWEIEVVPSASPLTGVGTAITTNPYTAQNLTPGTVYQYRVRSKCTGDVYSNWAGPFYFTTVSLGQTCGAPIVIGGLPYSTTDNTANYGNNITSSQGTTGCGTTTNYLTGNDVVYAYTATTTGMIDISMTPTDTYSGIFVYDNCANIGTSCLAGVGNSNSNIRNITNFAVTAGTTYYFVISTNATPVSVGYTLVIQQINCPPPTALAVGALNMTSVDLSWGNPSGATEWQVAVLLPGAGVPAGAGTTVTAIPYTTTTTLAGAALTPGTAYEYYVRAKCPDGSFSQWSGPKPFQTPLCNNACNFNFVMTDTYGDGWNGNTISIKQNGVVVGTLTGPTAADGTNPATAQVALCAGVPFEVYWNAGGSYPTEVGLTVITPFGITLYTKPPGTGSQDSLLYTGPTDCTPPTCPQPTAVNISAITTTSAQVSWTEAGTATTWEVIAVPAGSPAPGANPGGIITVTTTPSTLLSPLPTDTAFDVYVRAVCSTTDSSYWTGPTNFKTLPDYCGGDHFYDTGGLNGDYENNANVTTTICPAVAGQIVTVEFNDFNIETNYDYLAVYQGTGTGGTLLGTYTGNLSGSDLPGPFESTPGGCLTFVFTSDGSGVRPGWDATVTCAPVPTCPRPSNITFTNITQTSAIIDWTENGSATQWEIVILPTNSPAPGTNPPNVIATSVKPYAIPTNTLTPSTTYDVYIRSLCSTTDISNWSFRKSFTTKPVNDECSAATVVSVNGTSACTLTTPGTLIGATGSTNPSTCGGTADDDVWYQFTATSTTHSIKLLNVTGSTTDLMHTLYSGTQCSNLTEIYCSDPNTSIASDLIIGQVYTIRVYSYTSTPGQTSSFDVCVATPAPPIATNNTQHTVPQLVQDVLIGSTCAQVTNITWSTGTNFGSSNGIAYFTKNGSEFPFDSGIVLSTGDALKAKGPNTSSLGDGTYAWLGDTQLFNYIQALGFDTDLTSYNNATVLEFDFVPITNQLSFDFLFASEEYGTYQCDYSDAFAFFLTDNAGNTTNLALVPGTNDPISVTRIRDAAYNPIGGTCPSVNPQYFGSFNGGANQEDAAINFNGQTVVMTAQSPVTPNTQYHIKLVIADRNDTSFDSAVFLKAGSFNIGNLDLGDDLLISDGTAICYGDSYTIATGLNANDFTFTWSTGGNVIPGATGPSLVVTQDGDYTVAAQYNGTTCSQTDTLSVEFYAPIAVGTPNDLTVCDASGYATFDLTSNNGIILGSLVPADHTITFYTSSADAENETNPITAPTTFTNTIQYHQTIYVRVENNASGCHVVTEFDLIIQDLTPQFTLTSNQTICSNQTAQLVVTPTNYNPADVVYSWTHDGDPLTDTTGTITVSQQGTYVVTINHSGCTATGTVTVTVNPGVQPTFAQIAPFCTNATVPVLPTTSLEGVTGTWSPAVVSSTATGTYTFTPTTGQCGSPATMTITVIPATQPTFTPVAAICPGDTAPVLPTTSLEGVTGTWSPAVVSNTATGTYTFTPTTGQCAQNATLTVTVQGAFTYEIFGDCIGNEFVLNVQNADGALDLSNAHFQWYNSTGAPVGNDNVSFNVTNYYTSSGTTPVLPAQFSVKVTTAAGCSLEKSYTVEQIYCQIQRGISPNGDGLNDTFDLTGFNVEKLGIFNRYGTEVFKHGAGYTNQWFGQSNGGNELPDGTYFYVIELKGSETKTGWIYINREK
ncbi:choice-of-anchor L domain-containing protein [Flavobacterium inviolabile]|uniref:choice-of-anchor L domain-containing protein n=1 Tax=Flavobacterium inviolabile TaxID=2748320 RepID=UPI0015AFD8C9|nr:choice-of-anchor L domain-containing protein [Flavobacterium inviolabile]